MKGIGTNNGSKLKESAFKSYESTRDLEGAYKDYMGNNESALTSYSRFVTWASEQKWVERCHQIDRDADIRTLQETSQLQLSNDLSAEKVAQILYQTCLSEMELLRGELTHRDIAAYLKIANDVGSRHKDNDPKVQVNVQQNQGIVDIDSKILKELGRKMVEGKDASQD